MVRTGFVTGLIEPKEFIIKSGKNAGQPFHTIKVKITLVDHREGKEEFTESFWGQFALPQDEKEREASMLKLQSLIDSFINGDPHNRNELKVKVTFYLRAEEWQGRGFTSINIRTIDRQL